MHSFQISLFFAFVQLYLPKTTALHMYKLVGALIMIAFE